MFCELFPQGREILNKLCNGDITNGKKKVVPVSRDSSVGIATGYGLDDQGEREFKSQ
jgi:hypothetical protein